ncbi:unnamed protein product, partial [Iphiclides podalirius]
MSCRSPTPCRGHNATLSPPRPVMNNINVLFAAPLRSPDASRCRPGEYRRLLTPSFRLSGAWWTCVRVSCTSL